MPRRVAGLPQLTGRFLVVGRHTHDTAFPRLLRDRAGLTIASSSDFPRGVDTSRLGGADGIYFEHLGVAVSATAPDQVRALGGPMGTSDIVTTEPERFVYGLHVPRADQPPTAVPTRAGSGGPRGADVVAGAPSSGMVLRATAHTREDGVTWGLTSTAVAACTFTGRGVRVAVLDTGLDLEHPDFVGRSVVHSSFIEGEAVQDGYGHGTHCVGTAVGPAQPNTQPRYGIAHGADLYVGKVLDNTCSGRDGSVMAGLNWAIANKCRVISMSLGSSAVPGQGYSRAYETVAQRALTANTLIIAAAGNESERRNNVINLVGSPADCPSIMAVGAIDAEMRIADFSTRSGTDDGGRIDIVGPGVEVYSTIPMPGRYARRDGTSMACPHVAGIAALYIEANPNASARDIWKMLTDNAKALLLEAADVGAGLVQAPRGRA